MNDLKTILNKNSFIKELNSTLKNGGVIAFVTDTVWGIGCLPNNETAVNKIYEIKGRDRSKPLILMSNQTDNLLPYIEELPSIGKKLINNYFPGALTIVTKKSLKTPDYITANKDTVGIRIPDNEFFKELCSVIEGNVLATTSANLSNHPSSKTYKEAINSIGNLVNIVFEDYGYSCNGLESTVAFIDETGYKILRQGSINLNQNLQD